MKELMHFHIILMGYISKTIREKASKCYVIYSEQSLQHILTTTKVLNSDLVVSV
jgi:hypothetical protein